MEAWFISGCRTCLKAVVAIVVLSVASLDLDRPDGGYIGWAVSLVVSAMISCLEDVREIFYTPLAALTLAKLASLAFYFYIGMLLFVMGKAVWSLIRGYLEKWEEERLEQEREAVRIRQMEEKTYSEEARKLCAEYVAAMEAAESLSSLEFLYHDAISKWPKYEKSLSAVYRKRKSWLDRKNGKPG